MFDTFNQLFPPCGPDTPDQKKILCGCDPTNPEHHVRHATVAKGRADGIVFSKGLSPSKMAAILARFGVETRKSALNPETSVVLESPGLTVPVRGPDMRPAHGATGKVRGEAWAAVSPTGVGTYLNV